MIYTLEQRIQFIRVYQAMDHYEGAILRLCLRDGHFIRRRQPLDENVEADTLGFAGELRDFRVGPLRHVLRQWPVCLEGSLDRAL